MPGGDTFLQQFMAGWQMGQQRNQNTRQNQELQMEQQRQQQQVQQFQQEAARREEWMKLQKQQIELQMNQHKFATDQTMAQLANEAQAMGGVTAADQGIPPQAPEMGGPPPSQINVRDSRTIEDPFGGPSVQMPVLSQQEQEAMKQREMQQKLLESLGMLNAQEGIKAKYKAEQARTEHGYRLGEIGVRIRGGGGSMTGEGGKPLLSGEINKFNDFRSGLNTLGRLTTEVEKTGAASKAGTMLPGFITEATGWGADAKARQAVLDQAKQVVGKAMEGGVLRKEDEAKYMRILPIISDPPEVARAKLNNLKQVMAQDAEIYLETLRAAGRDTSRLQALLESSLMDTTTQPPSTAQNPSATGTAPAKVINGVTVRPKG